MKSIHLFYIQSNFHLLISQSVIQEKQLKSEEVYYIVQRNIKMPNYGHLLYYETGKGFKDRIIFFLKNRRFLKNLFTNTYVYAYFPFDYFFPHNNYYNEYVMFEEGLSSYARPQKTSRTKRVINTFLKIFVVSIFLPFINSNEKGFLIETCNIRKRPKEIISLLIFSDKAYDYLCKSIVNKIKLTPYSVKKNYNIDNSNILVLDRLNPIGRPFSLNNYCECLKLIICSSRLNEKKLYVKFHPADINNFESKEIIDKLLSKNNIVYSYFNGSLEDLALEDNGNIFIGTNSTILFYAPLFGSSNSSISFARLLAQKDNDYKLFLERWGGIDAFCDLLSFNVECLKV